MAPPLLYSCLNAFASEGRACPDAIAYCGAGLGHGTTHARDGHTPQPGAVTTHSAPVPTETQSAADWQVVEQA